MTGPKTMTDKQLAANRRNAQRSTGPRTAAGKAVSRWNALKHGVLAQAIIPPALEPHESRAAFDQLLETLRQELAPATALEELLVERIATSYWRLGRVLRAESGEIAQRLDSAEADLEKAKQRSRMFPDPFAAEVVSAEEHLEQRIQDITGAKGNARRLRNLLAAEDQRWQSASDDEVQAAAAQELAALEQQRAQNRAQELDLILAQRSIPSPVNMAVMARYESMLERQIYQALQALERLQRMRGGEFVAPPLVVAVSPPEGDRG